MLPFCYFNFCITVLYRPQIIFNPRSFSQTKKSFENKVRGNSELTSCLYYYYFCYLCWNKNHYYRLFRNFVWIFVAGIRQEIGFEWALYCPKDTVSAWKGRSPRSRVPKFQFFFRSAPTMVAPGHHFSLATPLCII